MYNTLGATYYHSGEICDIYLEKFEAEIASIQSLHSSSPVEACIMLHSLSHNEDYFMYFCDEKYDIVNIFSVVLLELTKSDDNLFQASLTARRLIEIRQMKQHMGTHADLLHVMAKIVNSSYALDTRENFLEILAELCLIKSTQPVLFSLDTFKHDMVELAIDETHPLCALACNTLCNLARCVEVRTWLLSGEQRLVTFRQKLVDLARAEPSSTSINLAQIWYVRYRVWALLAQLAFQPDGAMWLAQCAWPVTAPHTVIPSYDGQNIVPSLLELLNQDPSSEEPWPDRPRGTFFYTGNSLRQQAWNALANMCGTPDCIPALVDPQYDLLGTLSNPLVEGSESGVEFVTALRMLWGLCVSREAAEYVVTQPVPSPTRTLRTANPLGVHVVSKSESTMTWISFLVAKLTNSKKKHKGHLWIARILVRLAECGSPTVVDGLLEQHIPQVIVGLVHKAGRNVSQWSTVGHVSYCLSFLMNMAYYDSCVSPLMAAETLHVMEDILATLEANGAESLKAMIVVGFLLGREESDNNMLQARPEIIELILQALKCSLCGQHGMGYRYGTFRLHLLLRACLVMAVSDSNKTQLASEWLVRLLKEELLDRYVQGKPAVTPPSDSVHRGEGGMDDVVAVELAIETLLQLSFLYDDNEALQQYLMTPAVGLLECMTALLSSTQAGRLNPQALRNADFLRSRLEVPHAPPGSLKNSDEGIEGDGSGVGKGGVDGDCRRSHIMLSYCWHEDARPELVKALAQQLREVHGYDVWRDEDGSQLLPHMCGSTIERMAEAVELSSVVIVCVSRQYKESANCRMEAKYANRLLSMGHIDGIIYVMMQEHYTTHSQPDSCSGWLGIMIGEDLWYPLYSVSDVTATSNGIARRIGKKCSTGYPSPDRASLIRSASLGCYPVSVAVYGTDSDTDRGTERDTDRDMNICRSPYDRRPPQSVRAHSDALLLPSARPLRASNILLPQESNGPLFSWLAKAHASRGIKEVVTSEATYESSRDTQGDDITAMVLPERTDTSHADMEGAVHNDCSSNHADGDILLPESAPQAIRIEEIVKYAFELMTNSENALVPSELTRVLHIYGISAPTDIAYLDAEDIVVISQCMKKVPCRKLLEIFHISQ